ncbi:MAG: hypothetical protein ACK2UP_11180 [Candidatus Promineifilaceae bacterium]|jgi:hypothetical protein
MPESNETLTDQVENDQIQSDNEQTQANDEQAELENLPDQQESESFQSEAEEAFLENEESRMGSKPDRSAAERKKAMAALKSITPPAGRRKRRHYSVEDVHIRFTSCGRCSLFLTTYRLSHEEEFLAGIEEIDVDWLILPWHPDMRDLVNKSYGSPVDIESYYLDGTCPECLRPFIFAMPDPDLSAWYLIKL